MVIRSDATLSNYNKRKEAAKCGILLDEKLIYKNMSSYFDPDLAQSLQKSLQRDDIMKTESEKTELENNLQVIQQLEQQVTKSKSEIHSLKSSAENLHNTLRRL